MAEVLLNLNSLLDRHDVEAVFVPGFILVVSGLLLFYPSVLHWESFLHDSLFIILLVLLGPFTVGTVVYKLGKLIEKIFLEKLLNLDLKRIGKVSLIVGRVKAHALFKKYSIDKRKTSSYGMYLIGKETRQEEKWASSIRDMKRNATNEQKSRAEAHNKRNKLFRGLLADSNLIFLAFCIKFGPQTMFHASYFVSFIVLLFLLVIGMLDSEKRELQIYYDADISELAY